METTRAEYVRSLIQLQSTIQQYNLITEESLQCRNELWDSISKEATVYFEEKLKEQYLRECAKCLCRTKPVPRPRLLCYNSKDQLGEINTSVIMTLLMIRDNANLFTSIGRKIDCERDLDESFLDFLSDDIVYFLFANFNSPEQAIVSCLQKFEGLIEKMFLDSISENGGVALQGTSFINRLLRSFLNRTEIRQYVEQIFGPTLNKVYNFRATPESKAKAFMYKLNATSSPLSEADKANIVLEPVLPQEEGKTLETMRVSELLEYCEEIVDAITTQLTCMPKSVRYLLKTIEIQANLAIPDSPTKKDDVLRVVVDFIFHLWWYPIMGEPAQYGLVRGCKLELEFLNNLYTIIKAINAVFHHSLLEATTTFASIVNPYISKKAPVVKKYLEDLLAISLPREEEEKGSVVAAAMCMSLESIRFLCQIAIKHINTFAVSNQSFHKYISRVNEFIATGPKEAAIFEPQKKLFKTVGANESVDKGSAHYVIFQDYCLPNGDPSLLSFDSWKQAFCKLLEEISLESYYQKLMHECGDVTQDNVVSDILTHAKEFPEIFAIPASRISKVNLLAELLTKRINDHGPITRPDVASIKDSYQGAVAVKLEKGSEIEQNMRNIINSIISYCRKIRDANSKLDMEIIPGLLATRIIDSKGKFPFFIEKVLPNDSFASVPAKEDTKSASFLFSTPQKISYKEIHTYKLLTSLKEAMSLSKKSSSSRSVGKKKASIIAKGASIPDFILEYSKLSEVRKLILGKEDTTNVWAVYKDFVKLMADIVSHDPQLELYKPAHKERVIAHIRNYITFKLYPNIFPTSPSEEDERLYKKLMEMQWLPYEHFDVKKEFNREELCKLVGDELQSMNQMVTPEDKISCFINIYKIVVDAIDVYSQSSISAGADDSNPLIVYFTLKAAPRQFYSNINYINTFRGTQESKSCGHEEYCYRTMLAAVRHFEEADLSKLKEQYTKEGAQQAAGNKEEEKKKTST